MISLKFGMWSTEVGGNVHSKICLVSSRQHRATEVRKLRFLSSCQYTHGVAHWLLGPHDTLPCVLIHESSKTFNNSRMPLHTILKFGSFVVLLDPLTMFQNLFVQMFDIIFTANQNFCNTFRMGKPYKHSVHYSPFPNL